MEIVKRLKEVRKARGLSQAEFAKIFNMRQGHYSKYESNQLNISLFMIQTLILHYNVNPMWLITGQGEMFNTLTEKPALITELMAYIIQRVEELLESYDISLKASHKADIIISLYNEFAPESPTAETLKTTYTAIERTIITSMKLSKYI